MPPNPSTPTTAPAHDPVPAERSGAAIAAHRARMRVLFRRYAIALSALAVALGAFVARIWSTSEITHAHLRLASGPTPPAVRLAAPAAALRIAWSTAERAALGVPYDGGTVVTYSPHTVTGRDGRTGAVRWTYTRTDRELCQVVQAAGRTVAFFRHDGNCDEMDAFVTATGARAWNRTLTDNGTPDVQVADDTIVLTTPAQVHSINASYLGYDHFTYVPAAGCRITRSAAGSKGVAIAQICNGHPSVVLHDPLKQSVDNDDKKPALTWTLNTGLLPASADAVVSLIDPATKVLRVVDPANGKTREDLPLDRLAAKPATIDYTPAGDAGLLWVDGRIWAVEAGVGSVLWTTRATQPPTVTASDVAAGVDDLDHDRLVTLGAGTIDELDGRTGRATHRTTVSGLPTAGAAYPYGDGYVVADATTTAVLLG